MSSAVSRLRHLAVVRVRRALHTVQGKQIVHFLHIAKTGGTAVKEAIGTYAESHPTFAIYLHPHPMRLRDVPSGERVFFFVRDPVSRFVSGFYSRQRQGQPRYFTRWNRAERTAFEHFTTANQLAVALSSPRSAERGRAEAAMRGILFLRDSYWDWFESPEYFASRLRDILFVGFQERLAEDFEILKSRLCLPDSLRLPDDEVRAHRGPNHVDKTLEPDAVTNLRKWYDADLGFVRLCEGLVCDR